MEVSKADHLKCLYITEIIHKSNCTIRTTHLWYYLLDMSLAFHVSITTQTKKCCVCLFFIFFVLIQNLKSIILDTH